MVVGLGGKGRLPSISYVPAEGERGSEELFYEHKSDGRVIFEDETKPYYG